ncbi:MAG: hypothetical protein ACI4MB_01995, partial [Candidatus Coproplasma sp.]
IMLYILECMALGILCMYGGTDMIMSTTGEQPTWKEAGVCILSWFIVLLVVLFFVYLIKHILSKKKNSSNNKSFISGLLYLMECMALGILCMLGGIDRKMKTTGCKATSKEVVYCIICWLVIVVFIISIGLILFC